MSIQEDAIRAIEAQQVEVRDRSAQWMVGEQLKDICRREPKSAELIAQDLKVAEMSITAAEKKIKAFADKHRSGNSSCVSPVDAEDILRKFYGLPEPGRVSEPAPEPVPAPTPPAKPEKKFIDLMDFL